MGIPQCKDVLQQILKSEESLSEVLLRKFCNALLVNSEGFVSTRCLQYIDEDVVESRQEIYMATLCQNLANDIVRTLECTEDRIVVPPGYMVTKYKGKRHTAWRCPNP